MQRSTRKETEFRAYLGDTRISPIRIKGRLQCKRNSREDTDRRIHPFN